MLSRPNRLTQSSDFDKVYKKGRHYRGKYGKLIVFQREGEDKYPVRTGIVVPGKQGKANVRNRAKRQIREVFQTNLDKLPEDCDITFICWDVNFDYSEIEKDITTLFSKGCRNF